ncbi:MAG TPA: hypothetical protein VHO06_15775 [Polyangia bacterium]|nr:hypothetical protein [Polyangia bacterium]
MARPDPIKYAERLYGAIRAANFSPISFLAFGNAVKEGVAMRNMPRIAAEPFMRVVGEMLDLEQEHAVTDGVVADAEVVLPTGATSVKASRLPGERASTPVERVQSTSAIAQGVTSSQPIPETSVPPNDRQKRRKTGPESQ